MVQPTANQYEFVERYLSDQRITESLVTFKDDMVNRELKQRGVDAEWVLDNRFVSISNSAKIMLRSSLDRR